MTLYIAQARKLARQMKQARKDGKPSQETRSCYNETMETKEKTKGVGGNGNLIPPVKGERRNPNGRPIGQRNYETIYWEAMRKIGETRNMTPEQVEDLMLQSGLTKAITGDYRFYQDALNRKHGMPKKSPEDPGSELNPMHMKHSIEYTIIPAPKREV